MLVATMLTPQRTKQPQLYLSGLTPQALDNKVILLFA